jgi:oxygen-independent coproporphyrinogen-3 oxidase
MESYFELVVDVLTQAGYRWYETANFCLAPGRAGGRDLRARHNLGYWLGRDYLGLGIGAVSTIQGLRRRNRPKLAVYVAALRAGERPPREIEVLSGSVREQERLMLGLRLDQPLVVGGLDGAVDREALIRLERLGLAARGRDDSGVGETIALTRRGRFLGGAVTAELLSQTVGVT